jgi:peptide-methionine (S)-S-oxide reductase
MVWGSSDSNVVDKRQLPTAEQAMPGREEPIPVPEQHFVNGHPLVGPFPETYQKIVLAMGCFWGAERIFWQAEGVYTTAVGYAGGTTPNPTYEEVCSGMTGHTEVVLVVFDPSVIGLEALLRLFWEGHDPTQGMRQGNDVGTQYRSAIYVEDEAQLEIANTTRDAYQQALVASGFGEVTATIELAPDFFYAEHYHQQYLAKVPNGYCGLGGTGVTCGIEPLVKAT